MLEKQLFIFIALTILVGLAGLYYRNPRPVPMEYEGLPLVYAGKKYGVYSNLSVKSVTGMRVDFIDGSWCDDRGNVSNIGSGTITLHNPRSRSRIRVGKGASARLRGIRMLGSSINIDQS